MKKYLLLITLIAASMTARAQSITTLDWNELRIDSLLPHYSEVVPLAKDFRNYDFSVSIEYAAWAPLTAAEELRARMHLDELADSLVIESRVETSRGEGMLDIDFIPIIYNKESETLQKLLQCKVTIMAKQKAKRISHAASVDERWARQSVLATGKWHKIALEEDGIYALTPDFLKRMGISDMSRVKLYGYGGRMLREAMDADAAWDDLEEVPLMRDAASGALLFWGYGVIGWDWTISTQTVQHHTINPYSSRGYYFITEGDSPAVLETAEPAEFAGGTTANAFTSYWVRDLDEYSFATVGRRLWENKNLASKKTISIPVPNYAGGTATLRVSAANGGKEADLVEMVFNDSTLTSMSVAVAGNYEFAGSTTKYYSLRGLTKGNNILTLQSTGTDVDTHLEYIEINYPSTFEMPGKVMPFHLTQNGCTRFMVTPQDGQDIAVMRLGKRGQPATLLSTDSEGYYVVSAGDGDYVAFDRKASYSEPPLYVGTIANQNLHADERVDMVIITPASGLQDAQAQRLADAHAELSGLSCRVVRADKIYNEFSSGTPDATAYRRYMKMLYDRAMESGDELPRYLLLFGDCVWDNRLITDKVANLSQDNLLLCFESANSLSDTQSYVMEDYFGLLDDGEGDRLSSNKADIAIGRFPVRTTDEGRIMVDKTIDHLQNNDPGKWQNLALFLGDDGDENEHMKFADEVAEVAIRYAPGMDFRKVMWDSYKRVSTATGDTYPSLTAYVNQTMNDGAIMINYVGHGATYLLSHENVISLADFRTYDNTRQGFWFTAACDIMPFDGLVDNIGEASVLNEKGGTKVFIGTARTVYANYNLNLNRAFNKYIFGTDPKTGRRYSIGDALHLAKNDLTESSSTVNKLQYSIAGDPSLVFGQPQQTVVIDSVNGVSVSEAAPQVKAGSRCRMSGHIEDSEGQPIDDFYGLLDSRVMDTMDSVTCLNQAKATVAFKYGAYRKVLYEGSDSVRAGKFSISFVVPLDINYGDDYGRATFYAQGKRTDGTWLAANGMTKHYIVGGSSDELSGDKEGPAIDLWLESESFVNGARVSTSPMLYAKLSDPVGMNYSGAGVGHGLEVCIDDKVEWTFDVSSSFVFDSGSTTSGTLAFQLPVLTKGDHSLKMRAWDVLNNTSTATVSFKCNGTNEAAPVSAFIDSGKDKATITIVNRLTGNAVCDATVHLFDATGHLCFSRQINGLSAGETTRFTLPSQSLTSGIYFLQVSLEQDGQTYQSEIEKVILSAQ